MRSHLKVKVHTLSAEMTYIRRQEEKWKTKARLARQRYKAPSGGNDRERDRIQYGMDNFWSLHWHRLGLKAEARNTHLAYGFMKGRPYSKMEVICYGPLKGYNTDEPAWKVIADMVERFSKDEPHPQATMQRFSEWLADAKVWYEGNPDRIMQMIDEKKTRKLEQRSIITLVEFEDGHSC